MLKFLYIGDLHEMENIPSSRIDDFKETVHNKRKEILELAQTHKVNAILQGGDFFDKPKVSNDFLTFLMAEWGVNDLIIKDILLKIKLGDKKISDLTPQIDQSIPIFSIVGNHDLIGGAMESFDKSSLSILQEAGLIHIIDNEHPTIFKDGEISVAISGANYSFQIDDEDKDAYIVKEKAADYQIHLAHGLLTNKSYGKLFKHTLIEEIAYKTEADLTINGHDHTGFPLTKINNRMFVNPGSIVRVSASKKEVERMPKVLLISVSKEKGIVVKEIYLNSAKKGEEVLSREHITNRLTALSTHMKIEEIVDNAKINKGRNLNKIIENLGEAEGIDKPIIEDCTKRIQEMQLVMEPESNPMPDYYIQSLELENFLSHKHSFFDFSKNINVLNGKSRAGKSAVLRALKELQECYLPNPKKAIFQDEEFFRITATLSNGYIISRYVENKAKGKNLNGYSVFNPDTGKTDFYNTKSLPEIQKLFKFQPMQITDKKTVNTNFMMQGDGWFFTENLTAGDRAKLVGYSYGAHIADAVVKEVNYESKECSRAIGRTEKELQEKENKIKSYDYLKELQEKLLKVKALNKQYKELALKIEHIEKLLKQQSQLSEKIVQYEEIQIELKDKNEKIETAFEELKKLKDNYLIVSEKWKKRLKVLETGRQLAELLKEFQQLPEIKEKLDKAKTQHLKYADIVTKAQSHLKRKDKLKADISFMEALEDSLKVIKTIELKELKEKQKQIEKAEDLLKKQQKLLKEGLELKKQKDISDKKCQELKTVLTDELKAVGSCPVCHTVLNEDKVNQIIENL